VLAGHRRRICLGIKPGVDFRRKSAPTQICSTYGFEFAPTDQFQPCALTSASAEKLSSVTNRRCSAREFGALSSPNRSRDGSPLPLPRLPNSWS
jgi:hypothetical protein